MSFNAEDRQRLLDRLNALQMDGPSTDSVKVASAQGPVDKTASTDAADVLASIHDLFKQASTDGTAEGTESGSTTLEVKPGQVPDKGMKAEGKPDGKSEAPSGQETATSTKTAGEIPPALRENAEKKKEEAKDDSSSDSPIGKSNGNHDHDSDDDEGLPAFIKEKIENKKDDAPSDEKEDEKEEKTASSRPSVMSPAALAVENSIFDKMAEAIVADGHGSLAAGLADARLRMDVGRFGPYAGDPDVLQAATEKSASATEGNPLLDSLLA